jgi:hypothetical protein
MTKKTTSTKSVKTNRIVTSYTNSFKRKIQDNEEFSLNKAVKKIAHEINKILDHGYSREDVAAILRNDNIVTVKETPSNNSTSNIAVELLPKSESFHKSPDLHVMASYNDSNRVPGHENKLNTHLRHCDKSISTSIANCSSVLVLSED